MKTTAMWPETCQVGWSISRRREDRLQGREHTDTYTEHPNNLRLEKLSSGNSHTFKAKTKYKEGLTPRQYFIIHTHLLRQGTMNIYHHQQPPPQKMYNVSMLHNQHNKRTRCLFPCNWASSYLVELVATFYIDGFGCGGCWWW